MLAVLGATRALVAQSLRAGWPDEQPVECAAVLDQMIAHIVNPDGCDVPKYATTQFAPTGPIQEIAISNGWHDVYMKLAAAYDALEDSKHLFVEEDT
jgi:hypothetical protein